MYSIGDLSREADILSWSWEMHLSIFFMWRLLRLPRQKRWRSRILRFVYLYCVFYIFTSMSSRCEPVILALKYVVCKLPQTNCITLADMTILSYDSVRADMNEWYGNIEIANDLVIVVCIAQWLANVQKARSDAPTDSVFAGMSSAFNKRQDWMSCTDVLTEAWLRPKSAISSHSSFFFKIRILCQNAHGRLFLW